MAALLRSTKGRTLLMEKKRRHFGTPELLRDWSQLVETLLQWERWLRSDTMEMRHVRKAREKHRFIMYLIKKVAERRKGMEFKITKFHQILHMADDIVNFGVPMETDTGANESGHKATKKAARLTQRNEQTFDKQVAIRLEEVYLIEMAKSEIDGYFATGRPNQAESSVDQGEDDANVRGTTYEIRHKVGREEALFAVRMNKTKVSTEEKMEKGLLSFVWELQKLVKDHVPKICMHSKHKRKGQIFRGQANFRGEVWRDWAIIDWGADGQLPNQIWGFIDLTALPSNTGLRYADIKLEPAIYAIVQSASYVRDNEETDMSEIFVPLIKETPGLNTDGVALLKFYLADVEAIVKPIAVVPDIGGSPNAYLLIKERNDWRNDFVKFLESPDQEIRDEITEDEESESEVEDSSS